MSGLYDTMLYVCYMLLAIGVISAPIGVFTGILILIDLIEKRQNKKLEKMEEQESKVDNLYMEQSIERLQKEANDLAFMKKVEEYGNLIGK